MAVCEHIGTITAARPSGAGCQECLATGGQWVHLRMCQSCGHVGCCDNSPGRHSTAHFDSSGHPLIRSFEPGEEWFWCFVDGVAFELDLPPGPSHS
ncbi:MAG TPA: UBP-type zinc finger domain-containing protein [Dermatophilaceae bacterium]